MIVSILLLPYCYLAKRRQVNVNIMKNIFTLNAVQKVKQAERRAATKPDEQNLPAFKTYFKDKELEEENKVEEPKNKTRADNKPFFFSDKPVRKIKKRKKDATNEFFSAEQDQTSESGEDSTETSGDEDEAIKAESRTQLVVREMDYQLADIMKFQQDVYSFTICANMTKCCSPIQQGFALKQSFFVFTIQILVPFFFLVDQSGQPIADPEANAGAIRLICCLLLHMIILPEVKQALSLLRYLKFAKTAAGGKRGRMNNILLCIMQMLSPIFAEIVLILAVAKTSQLQMIIKSFVALGFVTNVDNQFAGAFPDEIKATAAKIKLKIGKDQNSVLKIRQRINRAVKNGESPNYMQAIMNFLVNFIFWFFTNFYVVFYYYFFPLLGIILQFLYFFNQEVNSVLPSSEDVEVDVGNV